MGAATVTDIARQLDVSHQAVSKRAKQEQWAEPGTRRSDGNPLAGLLPVEVQDAKTPGEAVARSAEAAAQPQQVPSWNERMPIEASAAGLTAAVLRQRLMQELRLNERIPLPDGTVQILTASPAMVRALSESYKVFIQGAQLLSGEATDAVTVLSPEDRQARLMQVLASIANRKTAAIEAEATED